MQSKPFVAFQLENTHEEGVEEVLDRRNMVDSETEVLFHFFRRRLVNALTYSFA